MNIINRTVMKLRFLRMLVFANVIALCPQAIAIDYYVSMAGDDDNTGTSQSEAWRSISKVNQSNFQAGDRVLFERGSSWSESLRIASSGTKQAPITFDAYGVGAKPIFYGTDVIQRQGFSQFSQSVYQASIAKTVNSLLVDNSFLTNARLSVPTGSDTDRRSYVESSPGSWFQDSNGTLYVNTGGADPTITGEYRAAVREDLVGVFNQQNIVIRNLVTDGSAKFDGGYGFRVQGSNNVLIENSEAYRAGKHHFGVINSSGFVGNDLQASDVMPQQGFGGATAYVAFSDETRVGDTSEWNRISVSNLDGQGAFYAHQNSSTSIASVKLSDVTSDGSWIDAHLAPGTFTIQGGELKNTYLVLNTDNTLVDGLKISGANGYIAMYSSHNTLQNIDAARFNSNVRFGAVIDDHGIDNTIRFSTFDILNGSAVQYSNTVTDAKLYGNIFRSDSLFYDLWNLGGSVGLTANNNFFDGTATFRMIESDSSGFWRYEYANLDGWQSQGSDPESIFGNPLFTNLTDGDLTLQPGSLAIDGLSVGQVSGFPMTDRDRNSRPFNSLLDYGAYESIAVPEPVHGLVLFLVAIWSIAATRRHRHFDDSGRRASSAR